MSVNEVRGTKAKTAFVVRGTKGPDSNRTFSIGNEDHTIGNALRHILMQHERVGFAGYSVPHPSEPVVQLRVQTISLSQNNETDPPPPALAVLKESCQTLMEQSEIVLEKLEKVCPETLEDRLEWEKKILEEGMEDDEQGIVEEDADMDMMEE
ncbi:hypothetical protein ACA910_007840 [Epithemia clementina (nom. ined.)]